MMQPLGLSRSVDRMGFCMIVRRVSYVQCRSMRAGQFSVSFHFESFYLSATVVCKVLHDWAMICLLVSEERNESSNADDVFLMPKLY